MEMSYCRRCGAALQNIKDHVFACKSGHTIFANASPTTGVFFLSKDRAKVLFAVRGREPSKGMLDAFGGICDGAESAETALKRELNEELGLAESEYMPLQYLTSAPMDYHYKGEAIPLLSLMYWSQLLTDRELSPKDDVADMLWQPLHDVDLSRMHADDIQHGIIKLRELF